MSNIIISIAPHEFDAMRRLVDNARAMTSVLGREREHCQKLLVWAQMVEDILERVEAHRR